MLKERISLVYRIKHLVTYHPWLKLISFLLAVITWFYVRGEIKILNR